MAVDIFVEPKGQLGISCDTSPLVALVQRTVSRREWIVRFLPWLTALRSQLHEGLPSSHYIQ